MGPGQAVFAAFRDDTEERRSRQGGLRALPRAPMSSQPSLHGLSALARDAKSWPFEQARLLLERILRLRLTDAERDLAATLFAQGKFADAVQTLPALARPRSSSADMA